MEREGESGVDGEGEVGRGAVGGGLCPGLFDLNTLVCLHPPASQTRALSF